MKISNRKRSSVYNFVSILMVMFLAAGTGAYVLDKYRFNVLGKGSLLLVAIPFFTVILFYLSGRQIFEYDSEGEALHFKNRNVFPFLQKSLNDEFPKYKLLKFEIINMFFVKRLYVTISSKNNGTTLLKYEISYLKRREVSDLRCSLKKVTKINNEKKSQ